MNTKASLEAVMAALFASKQPFLIIDTETTGFLDDPDGQIIEVSCVNQDGGVVFDCLVKPDVSVPAAATRVHGLTNASLAASPSWASVWMSLLDVLSVYPVIYAYNADFDRGMLLKTAERFKLDIPEWLLAQEWRCMMEKYAEYHGDWSDYHGSYTYKKLSTACATLGVEMSEVHRATGDCLNTLAVMRALANQDILRRQRISQAIP